MGQSLWLCFKESATKIELAAWNLLKENSKDENLLTIEVTSSAALEREHQRLVDEGWQLTHMGSGVFRRVSTYTRELPLDE
jgi:hypothetical protein